MIHSGSLELQPCGNVLITTGAKTTGTAAEAATASRNRIGIEIAADRPERGSAEDKGRAVIDVGGVDPDARPPCFTEFAEGRAMKEIGRRASAGTGWNR